MRPEPITDRQEHVAVGRQYLRVAVKGRCRPAVINNELIFQLAAMAVEKLVVGLVQYHREMPTDHTLSGLAAGLAAICPLDPDLVARIRRIEAVDDICTLNTAHRRPPGDRMIREILALGREVERFVDHHCGTTG